MGATNENNGVEAMKVLDTDIFIDYFRGVTDAKTYIQNLPIAQRATTDVTLMELFSGARNQRYLQQINKFINENFFTVLHINSPASELATKFIEQYTLSNGLMLPDALVAAIVLTTDNMLVTANEKHFHFIAGLNIEIPPYRQRHP